MKKEEAKTSSKELEKILCSDQTLSLEPLSLEELNVVNGGRKKHSNNHRPNVNNDEYYVDPYLYPYGY